MLPFLTGASVAVTVPTTTIFVLAYFLAAVTAIRLPPLTFRFPSGPGVIEAGVLVAFSPVEYSVIVGNGRRRVHEHQRRPLTPTLRSKYRDATFLQLLFRSGYSPCRDVAASGRALTCHRLTSVTRRDR